MAETKQSKECNMIVHEFILLFLWKPSYLKKIYWSGDLSNTKQNTL